MTRREALISLNTVLDIGSIRLKKLLGIFGEPQEILKASSDKLMQVSGIGERIAHKISAFKTGDLESEFKLARKLGLKILTYEEKDYPENLKDIYDPPIVLYVKGDLTPTDNNSLAIVGSRRASVYGLSNAEKFASELAARGIVVVSGMARGIDTYAHKGAIKARGRTIAVMGSGFNHIYPPENIKLCAEISENGAVISEFSVNTLPFPQNFPRRNRVISGLALGVLVVEAVKNSGALITADFALEQGREVFAIPGKIDSLSSYGSNELIKQGARLVSGVDDIFEEFLGLSAPAEKEPAPKASLLADRNEGVLYGLINDRAVSLDELIEQTDMDISQVSGILLRLQLRNLIKRLPGKYFVRSENEEKEPCYR